VNNKKQHINHDADTFKRYLNNEMTPKEANAFERQLLNDPFESEALEGLSNIDSQTIDADLKAIKNKLGKKTIPLWRRPALYAAASVAIAISIVSTLWLLVPEQPVTVSDNLKEYSVEETLSEPIKLKEKAEPEKASVIEKKEEATIETVVLPPIEEKTQVKAPQVAAASKPQARQIQSRNNFKLADADSHAIEVPKTMGKKSRVEEEVMVVDYGTIEGTKLESFASVSSDKELKIIKGKVMDRNKAPLPGATIYVKGTQHGAVADLDGNYEIPVPAGDTTKPLMVNFIGYMPQETLNSPHDSINFILEEDLIALNEVVATGYSKEKKRYINEFINAEPKGGLEQYIVDVENSLRYPKNGTGKKELVVSLVTISQSGDIKNIEIKRSPGDAYSMETIRAIRNAVEWIPATNRGFPVEDTIKIKLRFTPN